MFSRVRASARVSRLPSTGIDAEKSPCPSRTADRVMARKGRAMRRPSRTPASTASAPTTSANNARRRRNRATELSTAAAGRRTSISATPSPVEASTGTLAAYTSSLSMRRALNSPVGQRRGVQLAHRLVDRVDPVRKLQQPHVLAGLGADLRSRSDRRAGVRRRRARRARPAPRSPSRAGRRARRDRTSAAARPVPRLAASSAPTAAACPEAAMRLGALQHGAGVEPAGRAEALQERHAAARAALRRQPLERRAAGQQARRGETVLARAADLVARGETGDSHARERLLLGLVAQQPGGHPPDPGHHRHREASPSRAPAAGRASSGPARRPRISETRISGGRRTVQAVRRADCHSTKVLMTSVRIASSASSDATAKAPTKSYSL